MRGRRVSRRTFLAGAAGIAAGLAACTAGGDDADDVAGPPATSSLAASAAADCTAAVGASLWRTAWERGLVYGSSAATWQVSDPAYRRLFTREAAVLFTEDDLLWWRLRPSPDAMLDFDHGDEIVAFAKGRGVLVLGAHLVWDEGFGDGWNDADFLALEDAEAGELLFGTIEATVDRYRGQMTGWIVANEVLGDDGLRTDVPWFWKLGESYVARSFELAHSVDGDATLLLNDFGYETDTGTTVAVRKRAATLAFLDDLLAAHVPVHALGIQAHLVAGDFADWFDARAYRTFLRDVADRGLRILITELDVLDDGLPADVPARDRAVAEIYSRYLDVALDEPAVASTITFGLSDRYTWLAEDFPREDGAVRRPLPYDQDLERKPAYRAISAALANAPVREPLWQPTHCS